MERSILSGVVVVATAFVWLWSDRAHGLSTRCTAPLVSYSVPISARDSSSLALRAWLDESSTTTYTNEAPSPFLSRRLLLNRGGSAVAAAVAAAATSAVVIKGTLTPTTINPFIQQQPIEATILTVADVVRWIEASCDRRFLHAVVASDYSFLYRGSTVSTTPATTTPYMYNEPPDLLDPATYQFSNDATQFFQRLQYVLRNDVVRPSNGHLATTSIQDAAAWGDSVVSIWPVSGDAMRTTVHNNKNIDDDDHSENVNHNTAHYAWFATGGLFYPRPPEASSSTAANLNRNDIVIDGRDCGQDDSLEDALRMPSCEILVAAHEFLAVPLAMEDELRRALRASFLL